MRDDREPDEEWAREFIAETVIGPVEGLLHPELDAQISDGSARMVILRGFELSEPWRGHGLGASLIAGALRTLTLGARLAACRVSPLDFMKPAPDRVSAELASVRVAAMLESIGFRRWRGYSCGASPTPSATLSNGRSISTSPRMAPEHGSSDFRTRAMGCR